VDCPRQAVGALRSAQASATATQSAGCTETPGKGVRKPRNRCTESIGTGVRIRPGPSVIDDIGLLPISADAAEGLYRLVDAAYEKRSLALSTNIHPSGFDQLMDKTIASVLL